MQHHKTKRQKLNETSYRPTWAEIDLESVKYNLSRIRGLLDDGVSVMAVVKANAYGHGIRQVSRALVFQATGVPVRPMS